MFYKFLKIWANISFRFYFRRIAVSGIENIPKQGAVLFIVNHPNSFLEACLVACFQHRDLHFLVRGDMFEKKWLKPILEWTNQIPIFRFKDGYTRLKQNKSSFDESFKVLSQNKTILIFPEASTQMVKYLRPLQKGAARLAIGTVEEYGVEKLHVIPTGVYYSKPTKARSDVILHFGPPIEIGAWLHNCKTQADKLTELTKTFENSLESVVIGIRQDQHEKEFERLIEILEPQFQKFKKQYAYAPLIDFEQHKKLANQFRLLDEEDLKEFRQLSKKYQHNFDSVKSLHWKLDKSLFQKTISVKLACLYFLLGIPGISIYGLPLWLCKQFAQKKIKHIEFYAPVRLALSMFIHLLVSLILFWIFLFEFHFYWSTFILFVLQLSLLSFLKFLDHKPYLKTIFNHLSAREKQQKMQLRNDIINQFGMRRDENCIHLPDLGSYH
ncbi:MAG: 1-acyl-sn-glycerol-3-phosphate acyltransferase [Saprospiraceae bacterium]|nr:1-acyl-sn-glycerol-3-phosphate acyltransferase [Saprospiraceae bacterium]